MENSDILLRIYKDLTGTDLNPAEKENRVIMQKIVFLLSELGLTVGNYKFVWDRYGPFSQSLQNDINEIKQDDTPFSGVFSESVQQSIIFVKRILQKSEETSYGFRNWIEAVASLLFLKKYMYPSFNWDQINTKLVSLKAYLSNEEDNKEAIESCKSILEYNI